MKGLFVLSVAVIVLWHRSPGAQEQTYREKGEMMTITTSQAYCDPSGAKFPDGSCMPPAGYQGTLPDDVRLKLYSRCEKAGRDEFTSNCCDHLSDDLAQNFNLCTHAALPVDDILLNRLRAIPYQSTWQREIDRSAIHDSFMACAVLDFRDVKVDTDNLTYSDPIITVDPTTMGLFDIVYHNCTRGPVRKDFTSFLEMRREKTVRVDTGLNIAKKHKFTGSGKINIKYPMGKVAGVDMDSSAVNEAEETLTVTTSSGSTEFNAKREYIEEKHTLEVPSGMAFLRRVKRSSFRITIPYSGVVVLDGQVFSAIDPQRVGCNLIASPITYNEGRLSDFLSPEQRQFPLSGEWLSLAPGSRSDHIDAQRPIRDGECPEVPAPLAAARIFGGTDNNKEGAAEALEMLTARQEGEDCEAHVAVASIGGGGGSWEIVFDVETDAESSGGQFDFEVVIADSDGDTQTLTKAEAWDVTHAQSFGIRHNMSIGRDEVIDEVDVDESSVVCRVP